MTASALRSLLLFDIPTGQFGERARLLAYLTQQKALFFLRCRFPPFAGLFGRLAHAIFAIKLIVSDPMTSGDVRHSSASTRPVPRLPRHPNGKR